MSAVPSSPLRPAAARAPSSRPRPWPPHALASPLTWVAGAVAAAVLSWAVAPTVPSYDPWSWIVWGREVSDPRLPFVISGGPSWKPLPFLFTVVYGLLKSAAPTLWVITARAGGLLGIAAAARLAHRLAGGGRPGVAAGAIAAVGIVLTEQWMYYFLRGTSEVGLIAAALWAIDRGLAGRHVAAFWLGVAVALIRPESWPFLAVYAVWLVARRPRRGARTQAMVLAGAILVPALWFGPPWIGSGDALLAARHAHAYDGRLGSQPLRAVLTRGANDQVAPLLIGGIVCVVVAWVRDRDRVILGLGLSIVAWWAVVVVMTIGLGYPGLERFYLPAAGLISVLGAVGIVWLAQLAGAQAGRRAPLASAAALVLLIFVSIAGSTVRIDDARRNVTLAAQAVRMIDGMDRVIAAAHGHAGVYPCRRSIVAVNHSLQTALAWTLQVGLARVRPVLPSAGLDVVGPDNPADGVPAEVAPRLTGARTIARVGDWRVVARTDPRVARSGACVGR